MMREMIFNYLIAAFVFCALASAGCGSGGWGNETNDYRLRPEATDAGEVNDAFVAEDADDDDDNGDASKTDAAMVVLCGEGEGNELGIGKKCTKGGNECPPRETDCDLDLDEEKGIGMCVKLFCKMSEDECGTSAKCCKPVQSPANVCIPEACLPPECGGDAGTADDGGESGEDAGDSDTEGN